MADGDLDIVGSIIDYLTGMVSSVFDFILSVLYSIVYAFYYAAYCIYYGYYDALYTVLNPMLDSVMIFLDATFGFVGTGSKFLGLFPDMVSYLIVMLIGLKFTMLGVYLALRVIGTLPGGFGGFFRSD